MAPALLPVRVGGLTILLLVLNFLKFKGGIDERRYNTRAKGQGLMAKSNALMNAAKTQS